MREEAEQMRRVTAQDVHDILEVANHGVRAFHEAVDRGDLKPGMVENLRRDSLSGPTQDLFVTESLRRLTC
jgi:hypothetical protein